jgi:hypothetical protein
MKVSTVSNLLVQVSNVFFAFNKGQFTGVREMYVEADGETNQGEDITANIPNIFLQKFLNLQMLLMKTY